MKLNMRLLLAFAALFPFQNSHAQCDTLQSEFYTLNVDSIVKASSLDGGKITFELIIDYPEAALENKIEGTVILAYDIDSNFNHVNIRIVKGLGYGLEEAALKGFRNMKVISREGNPKCKPMFNLKQPVTFKLPED